jgi:ATP-dependent exoDNAse (exonuclease V) alpha subunit
VGVKTPQKISLSKLKPDLESFSEDQKRAWELLEGSDNVFITGEAGSGKSYVIRHFMQGRDLKTFPVLASTGAAAVLIGGRTFHSFMGLGIMEGGALAVVERALEDKRLVKRLNKAEGFIVDEISMLSGPTLQAAERICQIARGNIAPWGGLRVIAVGDFAQLPPIQQGQTRRAWAFLDPVWERTQFQTVLLRQNMRSANSEFLSILNDIRRGQINDRVEAFLNRKIVDHDDFFDGTRLFPRRNQTDAFNSRELEKLPGRLWRFTTEYSGNERSIEALKKNSPLPDELLLKEDAMVMLRQNDAKMRWVNGSTGHIRQITEEELTIELLNGREITIERASFSMLNAEGVALAVATNFPITLAYAATIHKAQGMTLDRMMVNLNALWEPGQAYVALSRIVDPTHLRIEAWQPQSIKADPVVERFYQSLLQA